MKFTNRHLATAIVGVLASSAALAAGDAAERIDTLDEVVVTAQKRTESIQSVPVSITLVDSAQLTRQGVTTITDLSKSSASLEFGSPGRSPGGGGVMRGIGTISFSPTAQPSVGLFVDGVPTGNTNPLALDDIERVEVLKGPQGTLFGSSSSAGVISISTKRPQLGVNSFSFSTELSNQDSGSDFSRTILKGAANLAFGSAVALRISGHANTDTGIFRNLVLGKDSRGSDDGVRARLLIQPSESTTIGLTAEYSKIFNKDYPTLVYRFAPAGSGLANALADCGVTPGPSNSDTCSPYRVYAKDRITNVSGQFDTDLGGNTLTVIASTRKATNEVNQDIIAIPRSITSVRFLPFPPANCGCVPIFEILPGGGGGAPQVADRKQNSLEVRLASATGQTFEWVGGVFGQKFTSDVNNPGGIRALFIAGGAIFAPDLTTASIDIQEYAGFGNLTWNVNESTRVLAGLRFTDTKSKESKRDSSNLTTQFPGVRGPFEVKANKVTYRFGVQRDFSPGTMGYATIATGLKGPQIADTFSNGQTFKAIKAEEPTTFEVGLKSALFDNRLAVNVDVFYNDVKNYQGQSCAPNNTGTVTCVAANVPKLKSKGLEVEIFGRPVRQLTMNLSGTYNPAKYPNGYLDEFGANLGGQQITYAGKTKVAFSAEYEWAVGAEYAVTLGADATYRSEISMYPSAQARFVVPSSTITNARLALKRGDTWSLALFARNIGRENFPRETFPTPFQPGPNGGLWQVFDANSKRLVGLQFTANVGGT